MTFPSNLSQSEIDEVVAASRKGLRKTVSILQAAIGPKGLPPGFTVAMQNGDARK